MIRVFIAKFLFVCLIAQCAFAQVSFVEGLSPLDGVVSTKESPVKLVAGVSEFKDCDKCPEMIVIPPGSFLMGQPPDAPAVLSFWNKPQHQVNINPFAVSKYLVTEEQWAEVMGANLFSILFSSKGPRFPAVNVSWNDAQSFVQKLNKRTEKKYRLLSDAEWEYTARAGTTTQYVSGEDQNQISDYAWFYSKETGNLIHAVGLKKPNQFGLYDAVGNVSQWTQDCWNDSYSGAPIDGSAWTTGDCSLRVFRSSKMKSNLHSAYRFRWPASSYDSSIGFRVASDL
jgi:eukaryotic-like serine/threonine-protein kinase